MSEDQNTSGNSERRERPSSGWQSAAGRGQSRRDGGYERRDSRGHGDRREGGRRWEDRGERRDDFRDDRRGGYGDRREGGRRDFNDRPRFNNDRREGDFRGGRDDRREGGFRGPREDRPRFDNDRREGGRRWEDRGERRDNFRDDRRGGYGDRREGGRRDFNDRPRFNNDRREGDFHGGRDDRRDSGFGRDPFVPEEITPDLLDKESRSRLMSLSKVNAERVARHLVYAGTMMDEDAELAYEHAQAAYRHAARVDIVREALGLAAYLTGRYSEALRELRTYRRMTDDYTHVAIEADSERGLGRPEKALAFIAEIPMKKLGRESQVELALVTSGARADAGDSEGGLSVLEKINPESLEEELRARFELIRADRLDELSRTDEAAEIRATWEPIFTAEGEVDLYEDEDDELTDEAEEDSYDDESDETESDDDSDDADFEDSESSYDEDDSDEYDSDDIESDDLLDDVESNEDDEIDDADMSDDDDFYDAAADEDDNDIEPDALDADERTSDNA